MGKRNYLTLKDVLSAHAEFGRLDLVATKKAMGPNWPPAWNRERPDIFERVDLVRGKHRFRVGQRVRPSKEGIAGRIFTKTRHLQSGVVTKVDRFNSPTVRWDGRKTAIGYWAGFIAPDHRRRLPPPRRRCVIGAGLGARRHVAVRRAARARRKA
jgi:hypothetical protein